MRLTAIIIIIVAAFALYGCGADESRLQVNADIEVADIAASADSIIKSGGKLSAVDDAYIKGMMNIDASLIDEYTLKIQTSGTEIDQYGIFKVTDKANFDNVKKALEAYLDTLRNSWDDFNYLPSEAPKLANAAIYTAEPFLIYTVMSEADTTAFITKFEEMR
jgi:hypothetical protein